MASRPKIDIDWSSFEAGKAKAPRSKVDDPFKATRDIRRKHAPKLRMKTSDWVSHFVRIKNGDTGLVTPIDFSERQYLLRPYDTQSRRILFMTSRQTEKCVAINTPISLADGRLVEAKDVRVGDLVATMMPDSTIGVSCVSWVSERRKKAGVRIETQQEHVLEAALTHPVRVWEAWREAGELRVGDRVAAVRQSHLASDLYWDHVKSLTAIDELECVDFEVEGTHNFVAGGLVTHNSTTLGNKLMAISGMRALYSSLFVTPSALQTTVFSRSRLDDIITISPLVKALTHRSLTMNLLEKEFINKSKIYLRYAFLNADRIRGLSVNAIFVDEIQDILTGVMPVIEEAASHHMNSLFVYSGTPKSLDNTIEQYWSKSSTQSEWCIPCEHHGMPKQPATWHWNVLGPKNIGKNGPICERCGNLLNPEHPIARWVEMNPGAEFEGFRICRLMVPWYFKNPEMWRDILLAYQRYPTAQFMNEVMALSYDSGSKPITRAEVIRACDDAYTMSEEQVARLGENHYLYMGIDWGTGESGSSYTVLSVGGYVRPDQGFQIVYSKRFDGPLVDPEPQLDEINRLIRLFRIRYIGADYGMGFHPNKKLTSIYGPKRVQQFQYAAKMTAKVLYKGRLHRYLVFRTPVMADVFTAIKDLKIRLPSWDVYKEPYASDILSITSEYSDAMKMIKFDKPRGTCDDAFHTIVFCLLASFHDIRRPDIMAPIREVVDDAGRSIAEEVAIMDIEANLPDPDGLY